MSEHLLQSIDDEASYISKLISIFEGKPEAYIYSAIISRDDISIGTSLLLQSYRTLFDYQSRGNSKRLQLPYEKKAGNGNPVETINARTYSDEFRELAKAVAVASGSMRRIRTQYIASKEKKFESYSRSRTPLNMAVDLLLSYLNVSWSGLSKLTTDYEINLCKPISISVLEGYVFQGCSSQYSYRGYLESSPNFFRDAKSMCLIYAALQFYILKHQSVKSVKIKRVYNVGDAINFKELEGLQQKLRDLFMEEHMTLSERLSAVDSLLGITTSEDQTKSMPELSNDEIRIFDEIRKFSKSNR